MTESHLPKETPGDVNFEDDIPDADAVGLCDEIEKDWLKVDDLDCFRVGAGADEADDLDDTCVSLVVFGDDDDVDLDIAAHALFGKLAKANSIIQNQINNKTQEGYLLWHNRPPVFSQTISRIEIIYFHKLKATVLTPVAIIDVFSI